jgi:hypothetical protein
VVMEGYGSIIIIIFFSSAEGIRGFPRVMCLCVVGCGVGDVRGGGRTYRWGWVYIYIYIYNFLYLLRGSTQSGWRYSN